MTNCHCVCHSNTDSRVLCGHCTTYSEGAEWALRWKQRAEKAEERVRELEDERDEMAPIISRAYELEHRLAAAEKVIEAARAVVPWRNEHRVAKQLTFAEASSLTNLAQALQDYDRQAIGQSEYDDGA